MTFKMHNQKYNVQNLVREIGYRPLGYTPQGELNCVKRLGADYPRFHIYLKESPEMLIFNIHLDQKKPVYEGSTAHGGDYESDIVKTEVQRIQDIVFR